MRGTVAGARTAVGNTVLMQQDGVDTAPLVQSAEKLRGEGASVVYVAVAGRLAGLIAVADPIKPTTPDALRVLREAGIRVVMATGDGVTTARAVARELGIDDFQGEVRPQDKVELVTRLQGAGPPRCDGRRRHRGHACRERRLPGAALAAGWRWPIDAPLRGLSVLLPLAVAYTAYSEWRNVYVTGSWGYDATMPTVFGLGLSPLAQWLVGPSFATLFVRQRPRR